MSEELVRSLLQQLVVAKACGPDGLSARILRECAHELAIPLCKLYKKSLRHGIFPQQWAEANIVPIFKKGDRSDPGNYCSVSLLPLCAKIFEKIITEQLYQYVSPHLSPKSAWLHSKPVVCNEPGLFPRARVDSHQRSSAARHYLYRLFECLPKCEPPVAAA